MRPAGVMKRIFRLAVAPVLRVLTWPFFQPRYLRGPYFDESLLGWVWVWRSLWTQKVLRNNAHIPWPVSPSIAISNPQNIVFSPEDLNNFQTFGCYFQNFAATIVLGRGTYVAPNVGIITANHDPVNLARHLPAADVVLGENCWIGMNAMILPGVHLGPHTVVGAGAVVTRSFPQGWCVVVGNPARSIRDLRPAPSSDDGPGSGPHDAVQAARP
jgi:acetyltransferase-like isoleucine patch superfamily enzyme